jgi:hypothetical protein
MRCSACRAENPAGKTFAWFTEGFDTRDPKEAKALPGELE